MKQNKDRKTIGYITPFIWGDISLSYFKGVLQVAERNDLNLICYIGQRFDDPVDFNYQANTIYNMMNESVVDGLVIWASQIGELLDEQDQKTIADRFPNVPITSIAGKIGNNPYVMSEDTESIRLLFNHLYHDHGHRSIGFVRGVKGHPLAESRYQAYIEMMGEHNIEIDNNFVAPYNEFNFAAGIQAADYYQSSFSGKVDTHLDAIICSSDGIARGVVHRLKQLGYEVPSEIAVVGINNKVDSRQSIPQLTTVDPHIKQLGVSAMTILNDTLEGEEVNETHHVIPALIVRQSCGCDDMHTISDEEHRDNESISVEGDLQHLDGHKIDIRSLIKEALINSDVLNQENVVSLLESSLLESMSNHESYKFVSQFSEIMSGLRNVEEDMDVWQGMLFRLRRYMMPLLKTELLKQRLQSLICLASVEVDMVYEYQLALVKSKADTFLRTISDANATLRTSYDFNELITYFSSVLPRLNIPGCYLVLFEDEEKKDIGRLVFTYEGHQMIKMDEELLFDTRDLLPSRYLKKHSRITLFAQSMYFREVNIGYIVFEAGPIDKSIYQVLSSEISGAIYRSRIFNSLLNAEREKAKLLLKIEERNQNLEKIVEERTRSIRLVNSQLEEAIVSAQKANAAKSQFLANISHEIRTPLNCIIGFADMIQALSKDETISNYIQLTIEETEKLMLLINQLLDITKIEIGKFELSLEPMALDQLIASLVSIYSVVTQTKGLAFSYDMDPNVPNIFKSDSLRLRQVLVNLIGNAIKFTDVGGVKVKIMYKELPTPTLLFEIIDTGIGIEESRLDAIFNLFEQESRATSRTYGGTGLGTAISKELVELMGGIIGVRSKKQEGSTFYFEIPIELVSPGEVYAFSEKRKLLDVESYSPSNADYSGKTILIVEDYLPNRMIASAFLESLNCEIIIAENGEEALNIMNQEKVDLILMDVQMPVMDGVDATRILRQNPSYKMVPIIGMTANAYAADLAIYKQAGMIEVVTKPFRKKALLKTVTKYLDNTQIYQVEQIPNKSTMLMDNQIDITHPVFRYDRLLEDFDGNERILDELLTEFIQQTKEKLERLKEAIEKEDTQLVRQLSHTIKGSALNMTADSLGYSARLIEDCARENKLNGIEELLDMLEQHFEVLVQYIKDEVV